MNIDDQYLKELNKNRSLWKRIKMAFVQALFPGVVEDIQEETVEVAFKEWQKLSSHTQGGQ